MNPNSLIFVAVLIGLVAILLSQLTGFWLLVLVGAFFIPFPFVYPLKEWSGSDEQKEKEGPLGPGCAVMALSVSYSIVIGVILGLQMLMSQQNSEIVLTIALSVILTPIVAFGGMIVTTLIADRLK
jgi:hypothetical protein